MIALGSRRRAQAVPARRASRKPEKSNANMFNRDLTEDTGGDGTHMKDRATRTISVRFGGSRDETLASAHANSEREKKATVATGMRHPRTDARARARFASHASAAQTLIAPATRLPRFG